MSYSMSIRGELRFASAFFMEMGLDGLFATCDDQHALPLDSISLLAPAHLGFDYECSAPAEVWYNLLSALRVMAEFANEGELVASFYGDTTNVELIGHGSHTHSAHWHPPHHLWDAHFALRAKALNTVEKLLKAGLEVNEITPYEETLGSTTLLWEAVVHDDLDAIALLLRFGASHQFRRYNAPILSEAQSVGAQELLMSAGVVVDSACFVRGWWEDEAALLNLLKHAPADLSDDARQQLSLNALLHGMNTALTKLHQLGHLKLSAQALEDVREQLQEQEDGEALISWLDAHLER